MVKKTNLKTIAQDLGLSVGTVSRVLNGKAKEYRISDQTVDLVLKYASESGYTPNLIAKGLRDSKTYTIGLVIPDIANPFFSIMAKNIEKAASIANYSIILVDAEENIEREKHQIKNMISRKVDGIIAAPVGTTFEHFNEILQAEIPLIFVDRYIKDSSVTYIASDNFMGGYNATNHLISKGHSRIGLIKGSEIIEPVKERRQGYLKALEEAGIKPDRSLIEGKAFSIESGYESTVKLLKLPEPPTALFAMSNVIGLGVLKALKEYKYAVPEDISLIIFDDQPYVSYLNPPITTIKQNSKKIGEIAIEYILQLMNDLHTPLTSRLIPTEIIFRDSVLDIK
jgi:LacI family transcriptional regulator